MTIINIDLNKLNESLHDLSDRNRQQKGRIVQLENLLLETRQLLREKNPELFQEIDRMYRQTYVFNEDYHPDAIDLARGKKIPVEPALDKN